MALTMNRTVILSVVVIIEYFIFRFPERLLPGFLDIVGHSHQWWHVFIFIGNFENLIFGVYL
jgi:predicted membrane channel-forming protein YqfA (hemolysin III family)